MGRSLPGVEGVYAFVSHRVPADRETVVLSPSRVGPLARSATEGSSPTVRVEGREKEPSAK